MLCEGCFLAEGAKNPCLLGRGSQTAKVMILQDYPNELDDEKGKCMFGKSCENMRKAMENRGIDLSDVYCTSLVKCPVPTDKVKPDSIKACTKVLDAEIKLVNPSIIIPLGNYSLRYCGLTGTITKIRGNAQEVELMGEKRIILPTLNPRMALKKPAYKDYILKDLDTLKELYTNGMTEVSNVDYRYLESLDEALEELDRLESEAKILCFDLETTGKSPYLETSKIVCISLTDKTHYGCVIPLYHRENPMLADEIDKVVARLKKLLENPSIPKVAHNGKFDIEWLDYWLGIRVANFSFDTMLAHYLAVSEEQGTQGLKSQAWEFTDMGGYDNALDEYRSTLPEAIRFNYDNIPWDILKTYAVADVDCCLRLMEIYKPLIDDNPKWSTVMNDIMMPASYALMEIEENGMKFDVGLSEKYQKTYSDEISRIKLRLESYPEVLQLERQKKELWREREQIRLIPKKERTPEENKKFTEYKKYENYKFNWGSVAQLSELLYDKLGLKTSVTTDTGKPSTGEEALKEISQQHEIPNLLLELRKVTTLYNMFIAKLPNMRDKDDIIHPSFNISGTVTGRMSSENPNSQQFPRKAENPLLFQYQNEPKSLFSSRFGRNGCIMNADYSALEMRIAGIISQDSTLLNAFLSGKDLHKSTASLVWNVPIDEVSKDLRTKAKSVNFGIIYGKSGITFAQDLYYDPSGKVPGKTSDWDKAKEEGLKLVSDYLKTFSGLDKWLKNTKKSAYRNGYVETMFGRRRRLPDLHSKVHSLKNDAERQAINAPIQGTGSDLTLLSIINIQKWLNSTGKKTKLICTVHDSLVFDVYIPELPEVGKTVKYIMEHVHEKYIDTEVPVISELELGPNYGLVWDVDVDEIKDMDTVDKFLDWVHSKKMEKYKKEIDTLHSNKYSISQVLKYLKSNNRPVEELEEYLDNLYGG